MDFFMCGQEQPSEDSPVEPETGIFTCGSDSAETYEQYMQRCRVQRQAAPFDVSRIDDVEPASLEWWSGESHDDHNLEILSVVPKHPTIELLRDERPDPSSPKKD